MSVGLSDHRSIDKANVKIMSKTRRIMDDHVKSIAMNENVTFRDYFTTILRIGKSGRVRQGQGHGQE